MDINTRLAIDLVDVPYHGDVKKEHEGEVRRSKAKSGTTHFFVYATAYVILNGNRYTLTFMRVKAQNSMVEILKKLMAVLKKIGVKISLLLLDRGFYSVKVIRYLKRRKQAFIMPVIKRGKKPEQDGGPTGTYQFVKLKRSGWYQYTLTNATGEPESFDVAVVCRNLNGSMKKSGREALVYATNRVRHHSLEWVKQTYRKRFGIESSYRKYNQAKIKTTTRNPAIRLFFYAVALILRNLWVWLHAFVIALPKQGSRILRLSMLSFQKLLLWLLFEIAIQYPPFGEILVPVDIHQIFEG